MAVEKLSQFTSGGAFNPATDQVVTVRTANTDVLATLGTAAALAASDATLAALAAIYGTPTMGHVAVFHDTAGTITDGGALGTAAAKAASNNSDSIVASVFGSTVANHVATFKDTSGTIQDGGAFTVTESQISLSDVTTDNVTSAAHGFTPKSPANVGLYLNGGAAPAYTAVTDAQLSVSDITTNNVSTSAHGFAPKSPGGTTEFLRADNAWAVPPGSGSGITTQTVNVPSGSPVSLTIATAKTIASLSLVAGTYEVTGNAVSNADTKLGQWWVGISTTNNTFDDNSQIGMIGGDTVAEQLFDYAGINAPPRLYTFGSTTTVYLVVLYNDDGSGTVTACGNLTAKKIG